MLAVRQTKKTQRKMKNATIPQSFADRCARAYQSIIDTGTAADRKAATSRLAELNEARGEFTVQMRSVGNPDFGQFAPVSNKENFVGYSVADCAAACRRYISFWNLGGGNWPKTTVKRNGKAVATVSYNGRCWGLDGTEIVISSNTR